MNNSKHGSNDSEKGKIKSTSAFDIKQTENIQEISWSNNKYESTYTIDDDKSEK